MSQHEPDLFQGLGRPPLSADLKHRVLTRARHAARRGAPARPSLVDRLWADQGLRLAWVALVALLLGMHLVLAGSMPSSTGRSTDGPPAGAIEGAGPDLAPFFARHRVRDSSHTLRLNSVQIFSLGTTTDPFT